MDTNLLAETISVLNRNKRHPGEVRWVSSRSEPWGGRPSSVWVGSWDEFARVASEFNYDNGYGGNEVNESLVVVGDDWWMERHEYDGAEWWEFKTLPQKPEHGLPLSREALGA